MGESVKNLISRFETSNKLIEVRPIDRKRKVEVIQQDSQNVLVEVIDKDNSRQSVEISRGIGNQNIYDEPNDDSFDSDSDNENNHSYETIDLNFKRKDDE